MHGTRTRAPVKGNAMPAPHMLAPEVLESAMRRALVLAARGPAADINPQVGCVILGPEAEVIAEGWHEGAGTPHAEIMALSLLPAKWRDRAGELTAVVTLEPCNHLGRTGPCAVALTEVGIGAVAYGLSDPGDESGGGSATLRAAGVTVVGGVLEHEIRALLGSWLDRRRATQQAAGSSPRARHASAPSRPRVVVKWAQTLDGRAAAADGSSQWITGPEARADVHKRRAQADAILIGTGTLYTDDPALTARTSGSGASGAGVNGSAPDNLLVPPHEQPVPVVIGHRPIPANARVREHPALGDATGFAEPIHLSGDDLAADLAELGSRGIRSVFVEGGPQIASSLLAAGLVDELLIYIAPALLGGPKLALGDIGVTNIGEIHRLRIAHLERLGPDLLITANFDTPATAQEAH